MLIDALGTDRATLAQVEPATQDFLVTHAFARPEIPYFPERVASRALPRLAHRLLNSEIVNVERPEALPAEGAARTPLTRKRSDEELQEAYAEIRDLKDKLERENEYLREEIELEYSHREVVGNSVAIRNVLRKVEQVARTDSAVLILGGTGTGKKSSPAQFTN